MRHFSSNSRIGWIDLVIAYVYQPWMMIFSQIDLCFKSIYVSKLPEKFFYFYHLILEILVDLPKWHFWNLQKSVFWQSISCEKTASKIASLENTKNGCLYEWVFMIFATSNRKQNLPCVNEAMNEVFKRINEVVNTIWKFIIVSSNICVGSTTM